MPTFINYWGKDPRPTCQCTDCGMVMPLEESSNHVCYSANGGSDVWEQANGGMDHGSPDRDFQI